MKFHDELNQKLFNKEELKPEVKEKLKEIAEAFIEYLEVDRNAIKDVVITGSSVSYNYTKYSDIDLHLKVDYDLVHEDCPIVEGYLWACKTNFNKEHDISIYGVPVELYAESIEEDTVHNGLYSLWQDKWIDKPNKIPPTDNDGAVLSKYNEIKDAADRIQDSEVASELIDKIYQMRKSGLQQAGEFSTENLAFKKLRDEGVLERLRQMKKQKIDKELSLESYKESVDSIVIDNYLKMLRDGGHLLDVPGCKYLVQVFTNKELQSLIEFNDVRKAAEKFIEFTDIYTNDEDVVLFKQMRDNGKDIKTIDSTWLNVSNKNESIKESEDKLDYEQFKIAKSNFGTYFVTPYDSRIGRIEGSSAVTVSNKLAAAINKYNSKSIAAERKALINKLHKLFKQAGIPKMQDMKSSIRGYRPITQNGYYIEIYKGDYTTFNIGITGNREELSNKIKEILNNEGVKYTGSVDYFTVDMEKQDNKNESIKESQEDLIKEANKITNHGMLYMPVRKLAAKLMDRVKGTSDEEALKVAKMFFKETKNESLNKLEETLKKAKDMEINEGMWASPFTMENAKQVAELLSKPITYEELNSEEGKHKYWNIIGDDEFWDNVADEAFDLPEADARYLIVKFLEDWIEGKENFNPDAYSQKAEDIIKKAIFMFNGITEDLGNKSIKEGFNKGDKVQLKRKNNKIGIVKSIFNGDKDKNDKDIKYLDVEFEDGTKEGRPASDFRKVNESIKEDYDEYDYEDSPEEMHKERYVTYFETQEGRQKYTIYHVYTDSTDDSYNELCDKRDNQLGMYSSYKKLKDALKERAEKIAAKQGWTVKSIENLGEDGEYYRERNKSESIKEEELKVGDIVCLKDPSTPKFMKRPGKITKFVSDDVVEVEFEEFKNNMARTDRYDIQQLEKCSENIEEEIHPETDWCLDMTNILDTLEGDTDPSCVKFNKEDLINFLNGYGYGLPNDCAVDEIIEVCNDLGIEVKEHPAAMEEDVTSFCDKVDSAEKTIQDMIKVLKPAAKVEESIDKTLEALDKVINEALS